MNKLQNLFADNRTKTRAGIRVHNSEGVSTVYLYDAIGGWYGVTAEDFAKTLNEIEADTIHLRINSPGGDVFEARAMQVALKQHSAKIIAHIDGLAASAATYVALGANEVEMADGAFFMIHNAWTLGMGNANDFIELADMLSKVDDSIAKDYQRKTGVENQQIKQWMDSETWFTAAEAKEHGFIDRVFEEEEDPENQNDWDLSAYANAPANLTEIKKQHQNDQQIKAHKEKLLRRIDMLDAIAS
ncbi:peptidase S14 [Saccharospirillum sp. MSK14-1]|uniref:head maturation protease, ClpP-related n=1 Tax=Saccharospirillum sp. MSK14-1 TaxID=1897632 RepID=UPI000D484073|nr:head maturation protease, ClpP-related [Saccharospirillum sp. MSK14-1]PTY38558.1 peptidase S14 [Saccharospirillum sp. MSK14-1]